MCAAFGRLLPLVSFNQVDLDNPDISDLSAAERDELKGWEDKFKYWKGYPIVGEVVVPPAPREFTLEELTTYNGSCWDPYMHFVGFALTPFC